jgi:GT2 family glycosyltransferase
MTNPAPTTAPGPASAQGLIDALIVAYGTADSITTVVSSLTGDDRVSLVSVVDHGDDGSGLLAARAGAMVAVDPTNPGFGAGMNRAARAGCSPFLLLMNPDAELLPGALETGLAALSERDDVAAVQGLITTPSTGQLERAGGPEFGPLDLLGRATSAKKLLRFGPVARLTARVPALRHQVERSTAETAEVETLSGTALLIRRAAFEAVDGFDERYFLYGEDMDLCRRLRQAGWSLLYLPVPWARHENGSSSDGWWNRELRWWEGTMAFAARWWSPIAFAGARIAALVMFARLTLRRPAGSLVAGRALVVDPTRVRADSTGPGR